MWNESAIFYNRRAHALFHVYMRICAYFGVRFMSLGVEFVLGIVRHRVSADLSRLEIRDSDMRVWMGGGEVWNSLISKNLAYYSLSLKCLFIL